MFIKRNKWEINASSWNKSRNAKNLNQVATITYFYATFFHTLQTAVEHKQLNLVNDIMKH